MKLPQTLYPKSPNDIEVDKIFWAFWQSSEAYVINEHLICMFTCDTKAVDKNGNPVNTLGSSKYVYKAFGNFHVYKQFKMSNGQYGADKTRPLKSISITSDNNGMGLDQFRQLGIFECYKLYSDDLNALTPEQLEKERLKKAEFFREFNKQQQNNDTH